MKNADLALAYPAVTPLSIRGRGYYRVATQVTVRIHGLGRRQDSGELCVITRVDDQGRTNIHAVTLADLERKIASANRAVNATRCIPTASIHTRTVNKLALFLGLKDFLTAATRNPFPPIRYDIRSDDVAHPVGLTGSYRRPLELVKKAACQAS